MIIGYLIGRHHGRHTGGGLADLLGLVLVVCVLIYFAAAVAVLAAVVLTVRLATLAGRAVALHKRAPV